MELQKLSTDIKLKINICHYPAYSSKWNPIEHKVFPHIAHAMDEVILRTHDQVRKLIENTKTKTGLRVTANIIDTVYHIGIKTAKKLLDNINIKYDEVIPGLNYSISHKDT